MQGVDTIYEAFKARIKLLEMSQRRLRADLRETAEELKETKSELEEATDELISARERGLEREARIKSLTADFHHYRGWWLNENCNVRVLLKMVPKKKEKETHGIAHSSRARYTKYIRAGSS